jgi:hypothetical protein
MVSQSLPKEGASVEELHQDCFVVFVRDGTWPAQPPEAVESPVVTCYSYEEAAKVKNNLRDSGKTAVIRSIGQTGGGD